MAPENVHQLLEKPLKERKCTFKSPRIPQLKLFSLDENPLIPNTTSSGETFLNFPAGKL